jgi:hypothetical protein
MTEMWFLIRGTFWFSLVLVMLPIFDEGASNRLKAEKGVELTDALGAAAGALTYVGSMCSEKPDVCVKGAETFSVLGSRAREGAYVAYSYLDGQFGGQKPAPIDNASSKAALSDKADDSVLTGTIAIAELPRHVPVPLPRPKDI